MVSFKGRWLVWIRAAETEPCAWSWLTAHISLYRNKSKSTGEKSSKPRLTFRVAF